MRNISTVPPPVSAPVPMYHPAGPGMGQQVFYSQPHPGLIPQVYE